MNFSFVHPQFPLPPLPECCSRGLRRQSKMNRSEGCWQLWKTLTMAQQIQTDPTTTPHKKSIWEIPEVDSISMSNWQVVLRLLWMGRWGLVSSFVERDAEPDPYFVRRYLGKPKAPKHASTWKVLNTAIRTMLAHHVVWTDTFNVCLLKLWLPEPASHTCQ